MSDSGRSKLQAPLAEWCRTAAEGEQKTVLVRPRFSAHMETAVEDLASLGVEVQSSGAGAITAVVKPADLLSVSELSWVQAVEEPRLRHTLLRRLGLPGKKNTE